MSNKNTKKTRITLANYVTIDNPHSRALFGSPKDIEMPGRNALGFKMI
ncbi:hypothetical protein [Flavobacterium sp.]